MTLFWHITDIFMLMLEKRNRINNWHWFQERATRVICKTDWTQAMYKHQLLSYIVPLIEWTSPAFVSITGNAPNRKCDQFFYTCTFKQYANHCRNESLWQKLKRNITIGMHSRTTSTTFQDKNKWDVLFRGPPKIILTRSLDSSKTSQLNGNILSLLNAFRSFLKKEER